MKASELMIGDWVMSTHPAVPRPIKVTEIGGGNVGYKYGVIQLWFIEPIPVTPEILEKNGFKLKEERKTYTTYVSVWDEISIISFAFYKETICGVDTMLECEYGFAGGLDRIHHCHIKYVHELQHALRLCAIKKEIEL